MWINRKNIKINNEIFYIFIVQDYICLETKKKKNIIIIIILPLQSLEKVILFFKSKCVVACLYYFKDFIFDFLIEYWLIRKTKVIFRGLQVCFHIKNSIQ